MEQSHLRDPGSQDPGFIGRGISFPMGVDHTGSIALTSGPEDLDRSIRVVLATAPGERVMRPEFGCGIHELVFAPNDAATRGMAEHHVDEALRLWEPRIEVLEVRATAAGAQDEELRISIDYRVRTTDSRFNLVYPFYLERGRP